MYWSNRKTPNLEASFTTQLVSSCTVWESTIQVKLPKNILIGTASKPVKPDTWSRCQKQIFVSVALLS